MTRADDRPADPRGSGAPVPAAESSRYPWRAASSPVPLDAAARRPDVQGHRAGLVTRCLANTVDFCVVVAVLALGYAGVAVLAFLLHPSSFRFPSPGFGLVIIAGGCVFAVYLALSWRIVGRTYGNEVLGLRVVNHRGDRLRWSGAVVRAVFCTVFPIGLLWVAVSRHNRSVQDVVLRTAVVYDWTDGSRNGGRAG